MNCSSSSSSSQHLCSRGSGDIVKRWVNEVQEALSSDNVMVQYHAMGLLYHIRKHDRLAVSKMVTKLTRSSVRSAHGYCLLVSTSPVALSAVLCVGVVCDQLDLLLVKNVFLSYAFRSVSRVKYSRMTRDCELKFTSIIQST